MEVSVGGKPTLPALGGLTVGVRPSSPGFPGQAIPLEECALCQGPAHHRSPILKQKRLHLLRDPQQGTWPAGTQDDVQKEKTMQPWHGGRAGHHATQHRGVHTSSLLLGLNMQCLVLPGSSSETRE